MRRSLLLLGLLTLAGAWLTALPQLARQAFWAHMTMHMLVVAVAAPLSSLGIAGARYDPTHRVPKLFAPIPASIVELFVVWGWHAPTLHHIARHNPAGLVAEQGMFLVSGLFLWLSVFGGAQATTNNERKAAGVIGLLLTSMHMTLLGALLALAPRALYHHVGTTTELTPLEDQHLGGAIMLVVGGLVYLAGGLSLTVGLVRSAEFKLQE